MNFSEGGIHLSVRETGAEELRLELLRMGQAIQKRVHRKAIFAAGWMLALAMRRGIRPVTGKTERNIAPRGLKTFGDTVGVLVGASARGKSGRLHIARLLEWGYVRRNQRTGTITHIPAHPFARRAYESKKDAMGNKFDEVVFDEIEKARDGR